MNNIQEDLIVTMEELAELQQAISKYLRDKPDFDNIHEEVADVLLCLDKLIHHLDLSPDYIREWLRYKLERNKKRGDNYEFTGTYIYSTTRRSNGNS